MAINFEPLTDLQATAEKGIEETKEEAHEVMDNYFDFLQKAVSIVPHGWDSIG